LAASIRHKAEMTISYDDLTFREKFHDICTFRRDIAFPFAPERFQEGRLPVKVGQITKLDCEGMPSCLDMLIKLPGHGLVLPAPYLRCEGVSQGRGFRSAARRPLEQ
jgi:hypothetical protein